MVTESEDIKEIKNKWKLMEVDSLDLAKNHPADPPIPELSTWCTCGPLPRMWIKVDKRKRIEIHFRLDKNWIRKQCPGE